MNAPEWKDLETKGFAVVPSFLSAAEIEEFKDDFLHQPTDPANRNYRVKYASPGPYLHLKERVQDLLRLIGDRTHLRVDLPQAAWYFATTKEMGVNFPWHQDHESFFQTQNHYDYLNLYIPVLKPQREKSNLSIIPFDVLAREAPGLYLALVRGGATHFMRIGNARLALFDDTGTFHLAPGHWDDMDQMGHTPLLSAGDLLVMRGDMIHKTQDADTERIALSFRVASSQTVFKRSRLADGGWAKAKMMAKNSASYQRMFMAFDAAGRDEMPLQEFLKVMDGIPITCVKADQKRSTFIRYLVAEKRRAGVLSRFARSFLIAAGLSASRRGFNLYSRIRSHRRPQTA